MPQHQTHKIHANTPVYVGGTVLCTSSSAKNEPCGLLALELSRDGKQVRQRWRNQGFTNLIAGVVVLVLWIGAAVCAVVHPNRGWQDRLGGTWVVRR